VAIQWTAGVRRYNENPKFRGNFVANVGRQVAVGRPTHLGWADGTPSRRDRAVTVPTVRHLALAVTAIAAVIAFGAVVAVAVTPKGGAFLRGETSDIYEGHPTAVFLKVAGSGRELAKFNFPACGSKNTAPVLKHLRISDAGTFSAERKIREVNEGARSGRGAESLDTIWDWKVSVKGRFTAPTRARGTVFVSYRHRLRNSDTGEILPGEFNCKVGKTGKITWKAKPATGVHAR
jgi:hypothetical protein